MGVKVPTLLLTALTLPGIVAASPTTLRANDTGRWKIGDGCYWDANDDGPDQCDPNNPAGRYKIDGNGGCYWEPNDDGADQCQPAPPPPPEFGMFAPTGFGYDPNPATSGGDLKFKMPCGLEATNVPHWVHLKVYVHCTLDGAQLLDDNLFGYGSSVYSEDVVFPASQSDRWWSRQATVYQEVGEEPALWDYLGTAWDERIVPNHGPASAAVVMDSFIPQEYVHDPINASLIDLGDNRDFGLSGGFRTKTTVTFGNTATSDVEILDGPSHATGVSKEYDAVTSLDQQGHLKPEALADTIENDGMFLLRARQALTDHMHFEDVQRVFQSIQPGGSTVRGRLHGFVANPLYLLAPSVDWNFRLRLTFYNRGIDYQFESGSGSDKFPSFEFYINTVRVIASVSSGNVFDLAGLMKSYDHGGSIR